MQLRVVDGRVRSEKGLMQNPGRKKKNKTPFTVREKRWSH